MKKSWMGRFAIYYTVRAESEEEARRLLEATAERIGWSYDFIENVVECDEIEE